MRERVLHGRLLTKTKMLKNGVCAALCTSSAILDYEEAVKTLNSLQTNAAVLKQHKQSGKRTHQAQAENVIETKKYLLRSGISLERLDQLSVLHVAGTKGKGSSCAFCESILRHNGYKTGFFSSPHLVAVRERIRINGCPISKQDFSTYFFQVFKKLNENKEHENDMPPYFKFLTIMAFYTFLAEKVDVAIIEVGIGGEHDCTNILRKVVAVGITSLGLDHTSLLGKSIPEIAWQKAGIIKRGCVAFTTNDQSNEAMKVLEARAAEKQCPLLVAPPLENYGWEPHIPDLGVKCEVQKINASLALQLANYWIEQHNLIKFDPLTSGTKSQTVATAFPVTSSMALGLKRCHWPGRTQVIKRGRVRYFLDGAHTEESMAVCTKWFQQESELCNANHMKRALIFNATGFRDSAKLLKLLLPCNFHLVIFCPNIVTTTLDASSDQANFMVTEEQERVQCEVHKQVWINSQQEYSNQEPRDLKTSLGENSVQILPCVLDVLAFIRREQVNYEVLVTGSLHLVGAVLSILDPELASGLDS